MSKPRSIQISIPEPCDQNWDEMTMSGNGRFCDLCQHTVIDFTTWSDTALYNFFSKETGHVCGRYFASQLDRPIAIPYQPHSRLYRITIALGLTLLVSQSPHLLAQNRAPLTAHSDTTKQKQKPGGAQCEVRGQVLDDKKEPMISVAVQMYIGDILKGGTVTDLDGNYIVKPLEAGVYRVVIISMGYDSLILNSVTIGPGTTELQQQVMKRPTGINLNYPHFIGYRLPLVSHEDKKK